MTSKTKRIEALEANVTALLQEQGDLYRVLAEVQAGLAEVYREVFPPDPLDTVIVAETETQEEPVEDSINIQADASRLVRLVDKQPSQLQGGIWRPSYTRTDEYFIVDDAQGDSILIQAKHSGKTQYVSPDDVTLLNPPKKRDKSQ